VNKGGFLNFMAGLSLALSFRTGSAVLRRK